MSALSDNSSDGMPANLQNADLQNGNRRSGEYSSDGYPASATDRASQTSPLRQQIRPQSAQQVRQPQNRRAQITLTPDVLKANPFVAGSYRAGTFARIAYYRADGRRTHSYRICAGIGENNRFSTSRDSRFGKFPQDSVHSRSYAFRFDRH